MLIGIDQGTTGTTVVAYNEQLQPVAQAYRALPNQYPQAGWVEQRPEDVLAGVVEATAEVLGQIGGTREVAAVGLDNQGETIVAWDTRTGRALTPTIVWSDGRGAEVTNELHALGHAERVRALTGLELDPYFSAAKMAWLLNHDERVRSAANAGHLCIGTLDTWLAWNLGGQRAVTDHSTASRTQLFNLHRATWEPELLDLFGVPHEALAQIRPSIDDWGALEHRSWGGSLPWRASLVDQPAALAGNGCFAPSEIKVTYGTGCFALINAGTALEETAIPHGLLGSVAWSDARTRTYAFDGGVFTAGVVMNWLVDIGLVADVAETAVLAESVPDTGGVRFLPAFAGLGAPWWANEARGAWTGMSASTTRAHLIRAVLDSIASRVRDILEAAWSAGQPRPTLLRVDGGLTKNRYLMQRQADLLGIPVACSDDAEATARGAAALAAIGAGILDEAAIRQCIMIARLYEPGISSDQRDSEYGQWREWLAQARKVR